jgi:hypothetical protein
VQLTLPTIIACNCGEFSIHGDVACFGYLVAALPIEFCALGSKGGGQTIHVSVVHAECCGDQHHVVDLKVGGPLLLGTFHIFGSDRFAALLYFPGNCK